MYFQSRLESFGNVITGTLDSYRSAEAKDSGAMAAKSAAIVINIIANGDDLARAMEVWLLKIEILFYGDD